MGTSWFCPSEGLGIALTKFNTSNFCGSAHLLFMSDCNLKSIGLKTNPTDMVKNFHNLEFRMPLRI